MRQIYYLVYFSIFFKEIGISIDKCQFEKSIRKTISVIRMSPYIYIYVHIHIYICIYPTKVLHP